MATSIVHYLLFQGSKDSLNGVQVEIIKQLEDGQVKIKFLDGDLEDRIGEIPKENIKEETVKTTLPLAEEMECTKAFENIEGQTIERFYKNFLSSGGDPQYRLVVLGVWTIDLKKMIKMLTDDPTN